MASLQAKRITFFCLAFLTIAYLFWTLFQGTAATDAPITSATQADPGISEAGQAASPPQPHLGFRNESASNAPSSDIVGSPVYKTRVAAALEHAHGLNPLVASQIDMVVSGTRYQLIRYYVAGDAAYAVYDTDTSSITSMVPNDTYMVRVPSGNTILFIEPNRVFAYRQEDEIIRELSGAHVSAGDGETYSSAPDYNAPRILNLSKDFVTLQVFQNRDGTGGEINLPEPLRLQRLPIP